MSDENKQTAKTFIQTSIAGAVGGVAGAAATEFGTKLLKGRPASNKAATIGTIVGSSLADLVSIHHDVHKIMGRQQQVKQASAKDLAKDSIELASYVHKKRKEHRKQAAYEDNKYLDLIRRSISE